MKGLSARISAFYIIFFFSAFYFSPQIFADTTAVVLNEILIDSSVPNTEDGEYIEIYNTTEEALDLSGWSIDDKIDGGSKPYVIADGTSIEGNGFIIFYKTNSNIALNNSEDEVNLIDGEGNIVDSYSYKDSPGEEISVGKSPDGAGDFKILAKQTPGEPNSKPPTPTPTKTPTPTNTLKPTKTPKPTKAPRPTKEPTAMNSSTAGPTKKKMSQTDGNVLAAKFGKTNKSVKDKKLDLFLPTATPSASPSATLTPEATVSGIHRSKAVYFFYILGALAVAGSALSAYKIMQES